MLNCQKLPTGEVLRANYLIMDVLRSSDLFSRQSLVSKQLCYLICADEMFVDHPGNSLIQCTGCAEGHSPDTHLATLIAMGET